MPRKKDERLHALRQQQILEAAKRCFIDSGFHQTSMRQILDTAGISAGGAYNYFASKDDIVKAIVTEEQTGIAQLIEKMQATDDPLEAVAELIADLVAYTNREDAQLTIEIYAEACRNPGIKALEQTSTKQISDALRKALLAGIKTGSINRQYKANDCIEFLLALLEGYIGRIAAEPTLAPKKAAAMAKAAIIQLLASDNN